MFRGVTQERLRTAIARACKAAGTPLWSPHDLRHRRQASDACAAQRLEDEGLGLVAPMVAEQDQIDASPERHLAQGAVAGAARPRLDAVARARPRLDPAGYQLDRSAAARPATAHRVAVGQPFVGMGAEPVVNVQRENRDTERSRRGGGRVEQRGRVAPAAEGDGDGASPHRRVSARWCR